MFSIFGFILLFIFVIVFVPLLRLAVAAMQLRRKFKRAMGGEAFGRETQRQSAEADGRAAHRKVYSKEVGEYVQFEEIPVENRSPADGNRPSARRRPEPQISDAEFEDIV